MADEINPTVEEAVKAATEPVKSEPEPKPKVEEDQDLEQAKNIVSILKDPQQAPTFIKALAEQAGFEIKSGEKPKDVVKAAEDVFREALGDEYSFLAPKLLPGLKALIAEETKPLKAAHLNLEQRKVAEEYDVAFDSLNEMTEGDFEKRGNAIIKLQEEMPFTGKTSIKEYLSRLYKLAGGEKEVGKKVSSIVTKMKQRAEESDERLSSVEVGDSRVKEGSKLPTLQEAIDAAIQGKRI